MARGTRARFPPGAGPVGHLVPLLTSFEFGVVARNGAGITAESTHTVNF